MRLGKFCCFLLTKSENWSLNWCTPDLHRRTKSIEQWTRNWNWSICWTDPVACKLEHTCLEAQHVLLQRKKTIMSDARKEGGGGGTEPICPLPPPPPRHISQLSSFLSTFKRVRIDTFLTQLFITCSTTDFVFRTSAEVTGTANGNPHVSAFPSFELELDKVHGFLSECNCGAYIQCGIEK